MHQPLGASLFLYGLELSIKTPISIHPQTYRPKPFHLEDHPRTWIRGDRITPIYPPTPRCGKCGGGVWEGAKPRVWLAGEVQTDFNESSDELQTGFNASLEPFVVCWLLVCFLRPMWVVQEPLSDHVGRNSSCLACWCVVNWFQ